jgi:hypothetical protein
MRVMKFISVAVGVAMLFNPRHRTTSGNRSEYPDCEACSDHSCSSELGERDVQQLLRRLPRDRRKGRRPSGFGDED